MENELDEWVKPFAGKTESELAAMTPPPDLSGQDLIQWYRDRDAVRARLRRSAIAQAEPENEGPDEHEPDDDEKLDDEHFSFAEEKAEIEAALNALENNEPQAREKQNVPSSTLEIPKGNVADLLEQQIGMCAALIGTITDHVALDPSDPSRYHLMDRVSAMLSSSAGAARVVGQLRGIAAETKQTFVKKVEGARDGGVPQT